MIEFHQADLAPLAEPLDRLVNSLVLACTWRDGRVLPRHPGPRAAGGRQRRSFRELLTSVLQANLTQVALRQSEIGVQQNADMRKISAWVAIVAVPTMIAGIYGMNFEHMPELTWTSATHLALVVMAAACLVLSAFRRNGWL